MEEDPGSGDDGEISSGDEGGLPLSEPKSLTPTQEIVDQLKAADFDSSLSHFRKCEEHKFPIEELKEVLPDIIEGAAALAAGYSVPPSWALLCMVALVAILLPTAMLRPSPTVFIHYVLWMFIIHPGSVNTSGLFGLLRRSLPSKSP